MKKIIIVLFLITLLVSPVYAQIPQTNLTPQAKAVLLTELRNKLADLMNQLVLLLTAQLSQQTQANQQLQQLVTNTNQQNQNLAQIASTTAQQNQQLAQIVQNTTPPPIPPPPPPIPQINLSPTANAGADQTITLPNTATLSGTATDDGLPTPANLIKTWSKVNGPGNVNFSPNTNSLNAVVTFSTAGTYTLRLTANDGLLSATDDMLVNVAPPHLVVSGFSTTPMCNVQCGPGDICSGSNSHLNTITLTGTTASPFLLQENNPISITVSSNKPVLAVGLDSLSHIALPTVSASFSVGGSGPTTVTNNYMGTGGVWLDASPMRMTLMWSPREFPVTADVTINSIKFADGTQVGGLPITIPGIQVTQCP